MLAVHRELNKYEVNHEFAVLEGVRHGETPNELLRLSDRFYVDAFDKFTSYHKKIIIVMKIKFIAIWYSVVKATVI